MNPAFWHPLSHDRTIHDQCIVSAGTEPHYYEGLHSTRLHCAKYDPDSWQLFYYGYPDGCPTQQERMYAFKIYAMRRVATAGFARMLWMDSAFQPIAPMHALWKEINDTGWYIQMQGDSVLGSWCSDAALDVFGISRDTAMGIPLCYSGLVGLSMKRLEGKEIWRMWEELYDAGTFDGPHTNVNGAPHTPHGHKTQGHCSTDPRCHGHRHDEAALSFILWKMGLRPRCEPFLTLGSTDGFIGHHVRLHAH